MCKSSDFYIILSQFYREILYFSKFLSLGSTVLFVVSDYATESPGVPWCSVFNFKFTLKTRFRSKVSCRK